MKLSRDYLIAALSLVVLYLLFMKPRTSIYDSTTQQKVRKDLNRAFNRAQSGSGLNP